MAKHIEKEMETGQGFILALDPSTARVRNEGRQIKGLKENRSSVIGALGFLSKK